jgi:hypothetical protein
MKLGPAAAALAFSISLPTAVHACDSCLAASNSSVQMAFIMGSIFLSVTPLALVGSAVWWLWRRSKRLAAEEEAGVIRLPTAPARATRRS